MVRWVLWVVVRCVRCMVGVGVSDGAYGWCVFFGAVLSNPLGRSTARRMISVFGSTKGWQRYGGGERSLLCIWGCLGEGYELHLAVKCFRHMVWVREGGARGWCVCVRAEMLFVPCFYVVVVRCRCLASESTIRSATPLIVFLLALAPVCMTLVYVWLQ